MTVCLPSPDTPFTTLAELIRSHARQQPDHVALRDDQQTLSYAQLDALMDLNHIQHDDADYVGAVKENMMGIIKEKEKKTGKNWFARFFS